MTKAQILRGLFAGESGVIRIVGAHDGLTAKLVERNGFEGVWAGGLEISTSHAIPDASILTMTQYLEAASIMNDAVSLPVVADCDTGYGNSSNVMHMVRKYEAAGIAGLSIEDKRFPKMNSFVPGRQELAPIAEFVGKILAAKSAQASPDFMIIARVEALIAGWGQEEALRRAHAYVEAGADAIFIHSKATTPHEIAAFADAWDLSAPLIVCPTTYPMMTVEEIEALGIKMVIYANHGMRAAIRAVDGVLQEINRAGRLDTVEDRIAPMREVFELQGMPQLTESEKVYLRSGEETIKAIIPAAGAPRGQESLEHLLKDRPLAMLDIAGKPLLQCNVETLNRSKIYDIAVVTGYCREAFCLEGIDYFPNPDFESRHILSSIMCAGQKMDGRTLLIYSDILFENSLIERLKATESDFVVVVDNSFTKSLKRNKKLDLVVTAETLPSGERTLTYDRLYEVKRIGGSIPHEEASAEFTGIALLSSRGAQVFKEEYRRALVEYEDRGFMEADNIGQASLEDFLQYLIERGHRVDALHVNSGWMEIHSFSNYKYACSIAR